MTKLTDDLVEVFEVKSLGVRGRIARLGPLVDDILHRHDYPAPVSALLAEAVVLTALLGASLKFDGKFILQSRTDGPVDMLVADFVSPGSLRGYARFDKDAVAELTTRGELSPAGLLGTGHLAMTVDQGPDMERYQGIVGLEKNSLTEAAHRYFEHSEQIPTSLRLAAGPLMGRGGKPEKWRAGGILIQHLPDYGKPSPLKLSSGDAPEGYDDGIREDNRWVEARYLLETVEDHELIDPMLDPERLLYRLFHEQGVTTYGASPLKRDCSCSRERVENLLKNFTDEEREGMVENGQIAVTCEFCSTRYEFSPDGTRPG